MTLTESGKPTFSMIYKKHQCIYTRQYHNLRPYIKVVNTTEFDPTMLPYWHTYTKENPHVFVGEFTAGSSGGQRKLFLCEMIYQKAKTSADFFICLVEPFAGVTDAFVPFVTSRLVEMSKQHNIFLVNNHHISSLKKIAENAITVSAFD